MNEMTSVTPPLPRQDGKTTFPRKMQDEDVTNKKIIREIGLKVTKQRLVILESVRTGPTHFTAQEVFERVSQKQDEIGFATVYRFLKKLSENSYVSEFRIGGMPARYEWASKNHHDHLTCTDCGMIVEFENPEIERLQEIIAANNGFTLTHHVMELYGKCQQCQLKENK